MNEHGNPYSPSVSTIQASNHYFVRATIRTGLLVVLITVVSGILSTTMLSVVVPRKAEGVRNVPVVSWVVYSGLALAIPIAVSIAIMFVFFRSWKQRFALSFAVLTIWSSVFGLFVWDILLRDFKGKF